MTDIIINFIDTPALFQQTKALPANTMIMQFIDGYIRSKVTQLYFVCFCISMEIKNLYTIENFLGLEIRRNACPIITKCESINLIYHQMFSRQKIKEEIHSRAKRKILN
jgi:hypothetical protein